MGWRKGAGAEVLCWQGVRAGAGGSQDIFETSVIAHARCAERGAGGREKRRAARALGCGSGYSRRGRAGVAPANGRSLHGLAGARLLWFGRFMPDVYTPGWLMPPCGLLAALRACGCCGSFGLGIGWAGSLGPGMSLFVRPFDDSGGVCGFVRRRWRWKGERGCRLLLSDCCEWG